MKITLTKQQKIFLLVAVQSGEFDTKEWQQLTENSQPAPRVLTPKEARELWQKLDNEY